jgi:hypothetical protein
LDSGRPDDSIAGIVEPAEMRWNFLWPTGAEVHTHRTRHLRGASAWPDA